MRSRLSVSLLYPPASAFRKKKWSGNREEWTGLMLFIEKER
jgi:hypothetical protein